MIALYGRIRHSFASVFPLPWNVKASSSLGVIAGQQSRASVRPLQPKISRRRTFAPPARVPILHLLPFSHVLVIAYRHQYGEPSRRSKDRPALGHGALGGALLQQVHAPRTWLKERYANISSRSYNHHGPLSGSTLLGRLLMREHRHPRGDAGTHAPYCGCFAATTRQTQG